MFSFLDMMDNREDRIVDNYSTGNLTIDTCYVNDALKPYETAVSHLAYNKSDWVIVEDYDNKEDAQEGHNRWVKTMTARELPGQLTDIATSMIAQFKTALFGDDDQMHEAKHTGN